MWVYQTIYSNNAAKGGNATIIQEDTTVVGIITMRKICSYYLPRYNIKRENYEQVVQYLV